MVGVGDGVVGLVGRGGGVVGRVERVVGRGGGVVGRGGWRGWWVVVEALWVGWRGWWVVVEALWVGWRGWWVVVGMGCRRCGSGGGGVVGHGWEGV